jgi:hypothetical protein
MQTRLPDQKISRRLFVRGSAFGVVGLGLYSGEFERHWIEVVRRDIYLPGLPQAFDLLTIAQLSDIHLDEFTEPFLLRDAIDQINGIRPDIVLLTGDYVSCETLPKKLTRDVVWQCASLLGRIECGQRFAILGNHDVLAGEHNVIEALGTHRIPVLRNSCLPLERAGGRIWLAGLDDPVRGRPDPDLAIPGSIRNVHNEPVILMCHAPDYVDELRRHPAGQSVSLVLSGHTHGGQIRLPFLGPLRLPKGGQKYVEGLFRFGAMQLYVNRGIGTVGVPFRFDCRPEITLFTMRAANNS